MIETAKMSSRGQIIIPKEIREAIGAQEDTLFVLTVVGDQIVMKRMDTEKIRKDIEEFWEIRRNSKKVSMKEINRIVHEARKELRTRQGRT